MDAEVLQWIVEHRATWLTTVFTVITTLGNTVWMFVWATATCAALSKSGRRADAAMVAGAMLTGWGVMALTKLLIGRARPEEPDRLVVIETYSLPSGHATMSALLATLVIAMMLRSHTRWLRHPALLCVPAVLALLIGFSRIYLGAHWVTDVLAGWGLGVVWGLLWVSFTAAIRRK